MIRKLMLGAAAAALIAPAAFAELQKGEQTCINKINKDGVKVQAAQLKVNDKCVKDEVKKGVAGDANTCIEADPKGKVAKKRAKTASDEGKKCTGDDLPGVFFTDSTTVNDAAEETAKALHRDIFGPTLDSLLSCHGNDDECKCHTKVINRVSKLARAMSKIWLKCKKAAMKDGKDPFSAGGADMNSQLEQCVTNAALTGGLSVASDTKGKISKATGQLEDTANQFCSVNSSIDEFATGACSGFSDPGNPMDGAGFSQCARDHVECRFCEMVNGADALGIDCDAWSGITCP